MALGEKKSRLAMLADGIAAVLGFAAGIALLAEFGFGVRPGDEAILHGLLVWLAVLGSVLPLVQLLGLWRSRQGVPRELLALAGLGLVYLVLFALAGRLSERALLAGTRVFLLVAIAFRLGSLSRLLAEARVKPALALVLVFLSVILVGTVLFSLPRAAPPGERLDLLTAFFTATSATCVTGLTVLNPGTDLAPFGRFVLLGLIQVGGLGLMTFTTLFLFTLGGDLSLKERELLRGTLHLERPARVRRTLTGILGLTLACEGVGAALLFAAWREHIPDTSERLVCAVFHGVSAFCNAGFSLFSMNLARFAGHAPTYAIVSALVITGGFGFFVLAELVRHPRERRRRRLSLSTSLAVRTSLLLLVGGTLLLALVEGRGVGAELGWGRRLAEAFSLAVNARTSGFNTADVGALTNAGTLLVLFLMFVGASPASTGGGIKTVTLAVFFATVRAAFRGRPAVEVSRRTLALSDVNRSLLIVVLGASLVVMSAFLLNAWEQVSFADGLFETVSAFGTVGLSRGVTSDLGAAGRLVLIVTMFLGRLGPMTVGLALTARAKTGLYEYPQEKVRFG